MWAKCTLCKKEVFPTIVGGKDAVSIREGCSKTCYEMTGKKIAEVAV